MKLGLFPVLSVVESGAGESWKVRERFWIRTFRELGEDLTNATDGGDGILNPTEEFRKKLSEKATGRKFSPQALQSLRTSHLGLKITEETRAKLKKRNGGMKGKHHTEATKLRISRAKKGNVHFSEEVIRGLSLKAKARRQASPGGRFS